MKKIFFLSLSVLFLFSSCLCHREEDTSIRFDLGTKNDFVERSKTEFKIDSVNKMLIVKMRMKNSSAFDFPADRTSGDTLTFSSFTIEFLNANKVITIPSARCKIQIGNRSQYLEAKNALSFRTDTIDLKDFTEMQIKIPYFYFSSVPSGNKKLLQVKISQNEFFSKPKFKKIPLNNETHDTLSVSDRKKISLKKMDLILSFNINIPKIYSSTFICNRIALQNDDKWSPSRSDFTIFQSSLPDIYFDLNFPDDFYLHTSKTQKSTAVFTLGDTSMFYYYTPADSIAIGVYDHDNFSRDDVLGYKKFSVNDLMNSYRVPVKFNHVDSFLVKLENVSAKN